MNEESRCKICKDFVGEEDDAWFFLGVDGFYDGCPCICEECMEKLEGTKR